MEQVVESRTKQIQCACGKWFWSWGERTKCHQCEPYYHAMAQTLVRQIEKGKIAL